MERREEKGVRGLLLTASEKINQTTLNRCDDRYYLGRGPCQDAFAIDVLSIQRIRFAVSGVFWALQMLNQHLVGYDGRLLRWRCIIIIAVVSCRQHDRDGLGEIVLAE